MLAGIATAAMPATSTAADLPSSLSGATSAEGSGALWSADTIASSSASLSKSRFVFRSDQICKKQVPAFKKVRDKLNYYEDRYDDAIDAKDYDLAREMLGKYGKAWQKTGKLISKRERTIKNLLPVRGKSPSSYLRALHQLARSVKQLGGSARALAKSPTTENSKRFQGASKKADKATTRYFKAARGYGFRSCSKPLAVD